MARSTILSVEKDAGLLSGRNRCLQESGGTIGAAHSRNQLALGSNGLDVGAVMRGYAAFQPYQKPDGLWYWFDELKAESLPYKTRGAAEDSIERYWNCYLRPWRPSIRYRG